jgi:hypothetical protein
MGGGDVGESAEYAIAVLFGNDCRPFGRADDLSAMRP